VSFPSAEPTGRLFRISFSTYPSVERWPVFSVAAAFRLRTLLALVAGVVVLALLVYAVFVVIAAVMSDVPVASGADYGVVY
jgi:hypothetical protein